MLLVKDTLQFQKKNLTYYPNGHCGASNPSKTRYRFIDVLNIYNPRQLLSKNELKHYRAKWLG